MYVRKAQDRGHADHGWLKSHHSFSFANYYDPAHMGFSHLRVINDDWVAPSMGFGRHGHRDMEIISYVIRGALAHKDSQGNQATIPAGDIQIMSAGTGIEHSEFNASDNEDVNFLQIWVLPKQQGIQPRYEQKKIIQDGVLTPIVTPQGGDTAVAINADVSMSQLKLSHGQHYAFSGSGYLHVVAGQARMDGAEFGAGDGLGLLVDESIDIEAGQDLTALWFDLS